MGFEVIPAEINTFANGLVDQIWDAKTDADVVCLCQKYEAQVNKLKQAAHVRYLHIVNAVQFKRREFARNA